MGCAQLNGLSKIVTGVRVTCEIEGVNMEETMLGFLFRHSFREKYLR